MHPILVTYAISIFICHPFYQSNPPTNISFNTVIMTYDLQCTWNSFIFFIGLIHQFNHPTSSLNSLLISTMDFDAAVAKAKVLPSTLDNETKLKVYALFKQATVGDVNIDQPWAVQVCSNWNFHRQLPIHDIVFSL